MNDSQETINKNSLFVNNETSLTTTPIDKVENVTSSTTDASVTVSVVSNEVKKNNEQDLQLTHLDKDFVYELMSIPSYSNSEYRLVSFVVLWARRNNIQYEFDDYGNVYLTKGELNEGEFYPCVTAHLDTVQTKQKTYAQVGLNLNVKTRLSSSKKHEIYVDGMGIGGDDKAGVLIGLSMFNHVDKLKAAFFLQEEIGCKGSEKMNIEWFKNVGYVIGYDSPDLNRAAYACSGVKLFSKAFFKEYMEDVCKEHGLTKFHSEPFTDVKIIREKTNIMCMNFGTGYYCAHSSTEYCVIEDMDNACRMGHALINKIGNTEHKLEHKGSTYSWTKTVNGAYVKEQDEDEEFFRTLSGITTSYVNGNYGGFNNHYVNGYDDDDDEYGRYCGDYGYSQYNRQLNGSTSTKRATNWTTSVTEKNDNCNIDVETLRYISDKYEQYVEDIKESVKKKCEDLGVDFEEFSPIFKNEITF